MVHMEYSVVTMNETDFVGVMDGMAHSVEVLDRMDHEVEDIPGVLHQANMLSSSTIANVSTLWAITVWGWTHVGGWYAIMFVESGCWARGGYILLIRYNLGRENVACTGCRVHEFIEAFNF